MVNIENTFLLKKHLDLLKESQKPIFGKLGPQQMVEHLVVTLKMSNGKQKYIQFTPDDKLDGYKRFLLSEKEMPIGTKVPFMGEEPPELINQNLEEAKKELHKEVDAFLEYFSENPNALEMHPIFGNLNKLEWLRLHGKHFFHHFKQFELL